MGLVDFLKYNNCTGWLSFPALYDKIANNTYTVTNTITPYTLANYTKAGYFNGASSLECTDYSLTSGLTISMWFNPTVIPVTAGMFSTLFHISNSTDTTSFNLRIDNTNTLICKFTNSTTNTISKIITANEWYHVCIVQSGTTMSLYINGLLINSTTITTFATSLTNILIGKSADGQRFTGYLKNMMLFNTALSTKQIQKLYYYTYIS